MSTRLVASGLLAVLLASGCSKEPASAPTTSPAAPTTSESVTSSTPPRTALTTTTPSATATGTAAVAIDQSTPEAAMTSWLNAMFAGDTRTVCALMASKGKAIAEVPDAVETCSSMIGGMLEQLEPLAGAFQGLAIDGATVSGETATFENATTQPPVAAEIIRNFTAVRLDGLWYITQG